MYINSSSSLWNLFKDNLKLTLEATDQIKIEKYSDFISINEIILNENKNKLKEILDEKYVIDKWKLIFDR